MGQASSSRSGSLMRSAKARSDTWAQAAKAAPQPSSKAALMADQRQREWEQQKIAEFKQKKAEKMKSYEALEHEQKLEVESSTFMQKVLPMNVVPDPSEEANRGPSPMDEYEMDPQLLNKMIQVGEATKTFRQEESMQAFEDTALFHRIGSQSIMAPTSQLAAAASAGRDPDEEEFVDPMAGKLSSKEMLGLYARHNREPETWTTEALAELYETDEKLVASILRYTSIPKIIPTKIGLEGNLPPQGVWPKFGGDDILEEVFANTEGGDDLRPRELDAGKEAARRATLERIGLEGVVV